MASLTEVVKKYFQKVDELTLLNAQVEQKRTKLLDLQQEDAKILKRHEAAAQQIREDRQQLQKEQAEFDALVDKSHLAFAFSVEELNEQALTRRRELGDLFDRIAQANKELAELLTRKTSTEHQINEALDHLVELNNSVLDARNKLDSVLKRITESKQEYELVKQAHNETLKEAGDLEKKRKHLDLMERRVRNYYKKAGLTFRP